MFTMTKEYVYSFAEPTLEKANSYSDLPAIAVRHKNGKWYAICPKRNGTFVRREDSNYYSLAEITPDGKHVGRVGNAALNKNTVVETKVLPDFRAYHMVDGRDIIVSRSDKGYGFDKDHIISRLYPICADKKGD